MITKREAENRVKFLRKMKFDMAIDYFIEILECAENGEYAKNKNNSALTCKRSCIIKTDLRFIRDANGFLAQENFDLKAKIKKLKK